MAVGNDLRSLGLAENEVKVYLDLVEVGKATAHVLSKRTGVPRTTVYWALENLALRGLISKEQKRSTAFYAVNQPSALLRMVEQEKRKALTELERKENLAAEVLSSLTPLFGAKNTGVPSIRFFEGEEGVASMLYDHLSVWQNSISQYDYTWWGYQDHTFAEHYFEWLTLTWETKNINEKFKNITNSAEIEEALKCVAPEERQMKFISAEYHFSSTIWALGDYIVLIMTSQRPHYAFQLHDRVFAENLRGIFKILFETSN